MYVNFPFRFLQLLTKILCSHTDKNNFPLLHIHENTHTRSQTHRIIHFTEEYTYCLINATEIYTNIHLSGHTAEERETRERCACLLNVFDVALETLITYTNKHIITAILAWREVSHHRTTLGFSYINSVHPVLHSVTLRLYINNNKKPT